MKFKAVLLLAFSIFILFGTIYADSETLKPLAEIAVNGSESESAEAVRKLRASGPEGLNALFDTYSAEIDRFRRNGAGSAKWQKIAAAIDAVAMQKDAYASGLYWYTDLDEAKKAAGTNSPKASKARLISP